MKESLFCRDLAIVALPVVFALALLWASSSNLLDMFITGLVLFAFASIVLLVANHAPSTDQH